MIILNRMIFSYPYNFCNKRPFTLGHLITQRLSLSWGFYTKILPCPILLCDRQVPQTNGKFKIRKSDDCIWNVSWTQKRIMYNMVLCIFVRESRMWREKTCVDNSKYCFSHYHILYNMNVDNYVKCKKVPVARAQSYTFFSSCQA